MSRTVCDTSHGTHRARCRKQSDVAPTTARSARWAYPSCDAGDADLLEGIQRLQRLFGTK